jgi:hypothetical protein
MPTMTETLYVQYGCGLCCPEGWANFDASPRLWLERTPILSRRIGLVVRPLFPAGARYGDIVAGLPVPKGRASGVYCSHTLEHLDRESVEIALKNTHDLLAAGGVFRLVVPCLQWRAKALVRDIQAGKPEAADNFMRVAHLGMSNRLTLRTRFVAAMGNSQHRWMYDEGLMTSLLEQAGFEAIRRCSFGDAEDPAFAAVEDEGRFVDNGCPELALEARKPAQQ